MDGEDARSVTSTGRATAALGSGMERVTPSSVAKDTGWGRGSCPGLTCHVAGPHLPHLGNVWDTVCCQKALPCPSHGTRPWAAEQDPWFPRDG